MGEYWIILDKPRFKLFPWVFRVRKYYGKQMSYEQAGEFYRRIKAEITERENVEIGVTRAGGIQLLSFKEDIK